MRHYYSVQALYNLLSWPVTSRFAVHPSAVGEPPAESSGGGQHYPDSPIYRDTGCNLFPSCLSCSLFACRNDLDQKTLKYDLRWCRHLRTTTAAGA